MKKKHLKVSDVSKTKKKSNECDTLINKTVYKLATNGKIVQWTIRAIRQNDGAYHLSTSRGYVDGKIVNDKGKYISKGKVKRTLEEQVLLEANSKLNKKIQDRYTTNPSGVSAGNIVPAPMLAQNYEKHYKKITFPALGQRKYDGVRALAGRQLDGNFSLMSRKNNAYPDMDLICEALKKIGLPKTIILDGELYSDTLDFQELTGLVKKLESKMSVEQLHKMNHIYFIVFDAIITDKPNMKFEKRFHNIKTILSKLPKSIRRFIRVADVVPLHSDAAVKKYLSMFLEDGFEGIMIRNSDSVYGIGKRSYDLQKYKKFLDAEYEIIGFEKGQGNDEGTVIWVCKNKKELVFNVRPRGTRKKRIEWYNNGHSFVGKMLTVRFQELTPDDIPRFPVGIGIRDYE